MSEHGKRPKIQRKKQVDTRRKVVGQSVSRMKGNEVKQVKRRARIDMPKINTYVLALNYDGVVVDRKVIPRSEFSSTREYSDAITTVRSGLITKYPKARIYEVSSSSMGSVLNSFPEIKSQGSYKRKEVSIMTGRKRYKPGQIVPRSGQAEIIGPRGGHTGEERTVTKGEPFPPTPRPRQTYKIVDPTKHRRKSK